MRTIMRCSAICLALAGGACDRSSVPESTAAPAAGPQSILSRLPWVAREAALPAGTRMAVRLTEGLSTSRNNAGDTFYALLDEPVTLDGREVLSKGTRFAGHVTSAHPSGRLRGRGVLGITLDAFDMNGQRYPIVASLDTRTTAAHRKRNIEFIGGGTGVGALIGGLTGGGKGAGIGAAVGAAAGTGVAATTGKQDVVVPAETLLRFTLKEPVAVKG